MQKVLASFILLILFNINAFSQYDIHVEEQDSLANKEFCLKYHFEKGDTLIYYVQAADSITIDYSEALMKSRFEKHRIVCDSVSENGTFFLSQTMIMFTSTQSQGELRNINVENSTWLNRTVQYEIDSLGHRVSIAMDDSTKGALNPGSPFQPVLFNNLGKSCTELDKNWLTEKTYPYPENGIPVPLIKFTYLYHLKEQVDTLGYNTLKIDYVNTGTGNIEIVSNNTNVQTTSILNGGGILYLSNEYNIPVYLYATMEQKLKIISPGYPERPGLQNTSIKYILEDFRSSRIKKEEE